MFPCLLKPCELASKRSSAVQTPSCEHFVASLLQNVLNPIQTHHASIVFPHFVRAVRACFKRSNPVQTLTSTRVTPAQTPSCEHCVCLRFVEAVRACFKTFPVHTPSCEHSPAVQACFKTCESWPVSLVGRGGSRGGGRGAGRGPLL